MTDKEMLELAARAAGIERGADRADCGISTTLSDGRHGYLPRWNPITDDGDAFRLAVDLDIHIMPGENYVEAIKFNRKMKQSRFLELHGDDKRAATRRAITRAAAEVGKILESK